MFLHHEAEGVYEWLDNWGFDPVAIAPFAMLLLALIAWGIDPDAVAATFATMVALSPIGLPIGLFIAFWRRWIHYIRFDYWFKQTSVLLHIELPPEVVKSPLAMELVLIGLHNSGGESTFIHRVWRGSFIPVHSLEIACDEGRIGYYLHVRKSWKDFVEARIYGQYPEARITEVDDYVSKVRFTNTDYDMWGTEYKKNKIGAVPIKTYIDWQLDQNPDTPETKIDPLTNIFEFMSTMGPGEHLWAQILIKARKDDQWYGIPVPGSKDRFVDEARGEIKKITSDAIARAQAIIGDDSDKKKEAQARAAERGTGQLTQVERDTVTAIERSMTKQVFDCGIRALYIAKKGKFNGARIGQVVTLFGPFKGFNSFGLTRGLSIFTYPWQDWNDIRSNMIKRQLFFWYKHRAYFYVPLEQDASMFTTEELASLWHFPNSAVKTPSLQRVPSRVSEAPINLPTAGGPVDVSR